jgi:hypothetical protein
VITEKKENVGGGGSEGVGEYGVGDLVRAQRGEIVFIQLPDHLPMPQPPAPKAAAEASNAVKTPPAYCSLSRLQVKIYVYHSASGRSSEKSQKR